MSQAKNRKVDELRAEYDFSRGVRGKHHLAYKAGTNVVVLDPDVAKVFPDASSVNRALRPRDDPNVSANFRTKRTQPETADVYGCVSQPRDRGSNPRTATIACVDTIPLSSWSNFTRPLNS
jgi:hypothetical protein